VQIQGGNYINTYGAANLHFKLTNLSINNGFRGIEAYTITRITILLFWK
jgi:hypothetical protein